MYWVPNHFLDAEGYALLTWLLWFKEVLMEMADKIQDMAITEKLKLFKVPIG